MAEQDTDRAGQQPNHASEMEKAEGSREQPRGNPGQHGAGITNRPLAEEQEEQGHVPPRGQRKDDGSHA